MCNVWEKRLASFFRDGWSRFGDRSYRGLLADESTTWCSSPIDWVPWSYGTRSVPTTLSGFGELRHTERAYYFSDFGEFTERAYYFSDFGELRHRYYFVGFRRVTAHGACLLLLMSFYFWDSSL